MFALCILMYVMPTGRHKLPADQAYIVGPGIFATMTGGSLIVLTSQGAAMLGAFGSHVFVVFFYGLVAMLLAGVVQFVRIWTSKDVAWLRYGPELPRPADGIGSRQTKD